MHFSFRLKSLFIYALVALCPLSIVVAHEKEKALTKMLPPKESSDLPPIQCCPGKEALKDQIEKEATALAGTLRAMGAKASESDGHARLQQGYHAMNDYLAGFDLKGCDLSSDPDVARNQLMRDNPDFVKMTWQYHVRKGADGDAFPEYDLYVKARELQKQGHWQGIEQMRNKYARHPKKSSDQSKAVFFNALLAMQEATRLDVELKNIRAEMAWPVSAQRMAALKDLEADKSNYEFFYRALVNDLLKGQVSVNGPADSLRDLERMAYNGGAAIPPQLDPKGDGKGRGFGFGFDFGFQAGLQSNDIFSSGAIQSKVASPGLSSLGSTSSAHDNTLDLIKRFQEKPEKPVPDTRLIIATYREFMHYKKQKKEIPKDVQNRFLEAKRLVDDFPRTLNDPALCQARALIEQAYLREQAMLFPSSDSALSADSGPWLPPLDLSEQLPAPTKQELTGDASCLAHAITATANAQKPGVHFDPYDVYSQLQTADRLRTREEPYLHTGLSANLEEVFDDVKKRGLRAKDRTTYSFSSSSVEDYRIKPLQLERIRELLDQKKTPILVLKNQARIQREDWIQPVKRRMGHALLAVGYGSGMNPANGKIENYILLRDSFSKGNYPVKMSFKDLQSEVTYLGLMNGIAPKP